MITGCVLRFPKRLFSFFSCNSRQALPQRCWPRNDQISTESQCLVWDARRLGTRTLSLTCTRKFNFSTFSPIEVLSCSQRSSFSYEEKGFHMQSLGSLKLIVFVLPHKHDGLSRFSDFLRNSKPKDQRLQVGLFY